MTQTKTRTREGSQPPSNGRGITTREAWAAKAVHTATLLSGATVKLRIPDLPTLMLAEALPETLRATALEVLNREVHQAQQIAAAIRGAPIEVPEIDYDTFTGMTRLKYFLAAEMVVEPEVTEQDFIDGTIPPNDASLLGAIAIRERDTDALGVRLGVAELSAFERFLLVDECSPGCEACAARRAAVSDGRLGSL